MRKENRCSLAISDMHNKINKLLLRLEARLWEYSCLLLFQTSWVPSTYPARLTASYKPSYIAAATRILIPSSAFSDTHIHMQTLTQTQIYTSIKKRKETAIIHRKTKTVKPLQQNVRKSESSSSEGYWDRLVHIAIITREKKFVYISPLIYHCLFFWSFCIFAPCISI